MNRRASRSAVHSLLAFLGVETDVPDLQTLVYATLVFALGIVSALSAILSWIQLPGSLPRVFFLFGFSLFCVGLLFLARRRKYYPLGLNLTLIALLTYLYFPSGGSAGAIPMFMIANAALSWILLFGHHPAKTVISIGLQFLLILVLGTVQVQFPFLVADRFPDPSAQTLNTMLWGAIVMVLLVIVMSMWSRLLQDRFNRLIERIEVDDLTGAYKKSFLLSLMETFRTSDTFFHRRHSVAFVDLDSFKQVNDTHGHLVGDELLVELVQRGHASLRSTDFIGRFGGDEFLFFFPDTKAEEALDIMERFRADVAVARWTSCSLAITISVGVGELTRGASVEASLAKIDQKLYESKHLGKNRAAKV